MERRFLILALAVSLLLLWRAVSWLRRSAPVDPSLSGELLFVLGWLASRIERGVVLEAGPGQPQGFLGGISGIVRGRRAWFGFFGGTIGTTAKLTVTVEHGRPITITRSGLLASFSRALHPGGRQDRIEGFHVAGDLARVKRAFELDRERLVAALVSLFDELGVGSVEVRSGLVSVEKHAIGAWPASIVLRLFGALADVAAACESRSIVVRVLGAKRPAWAGAGGRPRCPYCRGELSGDEEGLVACADCGTVHHDTCFQTHGRCTLLGCAGVEVQHAGEGRE